MKIKAGHLRLVPKPLAKCRVLYPPPEPDGVQVRQIGIGQRRWLLLHTYNGREVQTVLSTKELRNLRDQASAWLAVEDGDG